MTLPWDRPTEPAPPATVPVVARNPATGEQVRIEVSETLRTLIRDSIRDSMSDKPVLAAGTRTLAGKVFDGDWVTDRTLLHGAAIDLVVAVVAVVATILSPHSAFTAGVWVAAGILAAKTVAQAAISYAANLSNKNPAP